jgi:hypothetical protein
VVDPDALALVLLFSRQPNVRALGGGRSLDGIYQFFHRDELPAVKARINQVRNADPAIAVQMDVALWNALTAIFADVYAVIREMESSTA